MTLITPKAHRPFSLPLTGAITDITDQPWAANLTMLWLPPWVTGHLRELAPCGKLNDLSACGAKPYPTGISLFNNNNPITALAKQIWYYSPQAWSKIQGRRGAPPTLCTRSPSPPRRPPPVGSVTDITDQPWAAELKKLRLNGCEQVQGADDSETCCPDAKEGPSPRSSPP